jgi:hypothetical protein
MIAATSSSSSSSRIDSRGSSISTLALLASCVCTHAAAVYTPLVPLQPHSHPPPYSPYLPSCCCIVCCYNLSCRTSRPGYLTWSAEMAGQQEPVMMQKRGSSGLSATLAAAGLADPDILALAQVGLLSGIDCGIDSGIHSGRHTKHSCQGDVGNAKTCTRISSRIDGCVCTGGSSGLSAPLAAAGLADLTSWHWHR